MNLNFLKRLNKVDQTFQKPTSEEGLKPANIWSILLISYFTIGLVAIVLVLLSYNFLTKDREGVVDQGLLLTPQLNNQRIVEIQNFFEQKDSFRSAVYTKTIIDPSKN